MLATPVVTIFTQEKSNSCAIKTESVFFSGCIHLNKNVQISYYNIHHKEVEIIKEDEVNPYEAIDSEEKDNNIIVEENVKGESPPLRRWLTFAVCALRDW